MTTMRLSVEVLTSDSFAIDIYRAPLGQPDVLLATYQHDPENRISQLDVCMPAGTYPVVFAVKSTNGNATHYQPLFYLISFDTIVDVDACSSADDGNTAGKSDFCFKSCIE